MKIKHTLSGGVGLSNNWLILNPDGTSTGTYRTDEAFAYFLNNCSEVRILTDDSISCITYVLTLSPNVVSPYYTVRSNNFNTEVKKLLVKIGFIGNSSIMVPGLLRGKTGNPSYFRYDHNGDCVTVTIPGDIRRNEDHYCGEIEIVPENIFMKEITTQQNVFINSFTSADSPFEPICPGIIGYVKLTKNDPLIRSFKDFLIPSLQQRQGGHNWASNHHDKYARSDADVTNSLFNMTNNPDVTHMSMIIMEMMEGYKTLNDYYRDQRYDKFSEMHLYELKRLKNFGYYHMDPHEGNVMINPNYPYFTDNPRDPYYGRALIIDFGRIKHENQITIRDLLPNYLNHFDTYFRQLNPLRIRMADALMQGGASLMQGVENTTANPIVRSIIERTFKRIALHPLAPGAPAPAPGPAPAAAPAPAPAPAPAAAPAAPAAAPAAPAANQRQAPAPAQRQATPVAPAYISSPSPPPPLARYNNYNYNYNRLANGFRNQRNQPRRMLRGPAPAAPRVANRAVFNRLDFFNQSSTPPAAPPAAPPAPAAAAPSAAPPAAAAAAPPAPAAAAPPVPPSRNLQRRNGVRYPAPPSPVAASPPAAAANLPAPAAPPAAPPRNLQHRNAAAAAADPYHLYRVGNEFVFNQNNNNRGNAAPAIQNPFVQRPQNPLEYEFTTKDWLSIFGIVLGVAYYAFNRGGKKRGIEEVYTKYLNPDDSMDTVNESDNQDTDNPYPYAKTAKVDKDEELIESLLEPFEKINSTFDEIVNLSLKILNVEYDFYINNKSNFDKTNSIINANKKQIDELFKTCTEQIKNMRKIINKNNEDDEFVDGLVVELFMPYVIDIEYINRGIYLGTGLINTRNEKNVDYASIWFGVETNNNVDTNNKLVSIYNTKYKLLPNKELPELEIKNADIDPETFDKNLSNMFIEPTEIKLNLPKKQKKITKYQMPPTIFSNPFFNNSMVTASAGGKFTKKRKYKVTKKTKNNKKK